MPGTGGLSIHEVYTGFIKQIQILNLPERAAAISFNFLMAIPALLIFMLTLVPYLPIAKYFHEQFLSIASDITPNQNTFNFIHKLVDDFLTQQQGGLVSFGFLLVMFSASNGMMGIIRTFDRSLETPYRPNFIRKRLRAIRLTTVLLLLLIGITVLLSGQDFLFKKIMGWMNIKDTSLRWWIKNIRWLVIIAMFLSSIGIIYKYAPSVKVRGKLLSPGAFFATFLTILTTWGFSVWVNSFSNLNRIYGSIGTVMIIMVLIFLNSLIILIGFELNITIEKLTKSREFTGH
ncbi:MAG: inner rane protein YihY, formerly thought to be RNase [Chitinophagaceae bacterium]|nr:inner rane protein YihY, formerly thought to be RNase [Chitinophagaceae bacterium]